MSVGSPEKDSQLPMDKKLLAIMGLAMALPTTVLAVAYVIYKLIEEGLISNGLGITLLVAVIANFFFLMFRYLRKERKNDE